MVDLDGELPVSVELVWSRAKHVWRRHVKKDEFPGKSKFKSNNLEDVKKLTQRVVDRHDTRVVQADGRVGYGKILNKEEGSRGEQAIRVITQPLGGGREKVITSYPVEKLIQLFPTIATYIFGKDVVIGLATAAGEKLEDAVEQGVAAERNRQQREMIDIIDDQ